MAKTRVLVVDDAVLVRKIISDALSQDPELEVVGSAANGAIALQKLDQLAPDVVTLDVEMPEMDGIETLKRMRAARPQLPVIMVSALTERGGTVTLDALSLGAADYITKPSGSSGKEAFADQLRQKIHSLTRTRLRSAASPAQPTPPAMTPTKARAGSAEPPLVLAIGVSTGGPNALAELLPTLPASFPVPILITQHMPPLFTRLLAERLSKKCSLPAVEAEEGMLLKAGTIYIAPGDFHMEVYTRADEHKITLTQSPAENSCRPAVDVMLRSLVGVFKDRILCVILTGMGSDGLKGATLVKQAGGRVIAQDEKSSVVWGMPGVVVNAGLADKVLSLEELGPELVRAVRTKTDSVPHSTIVSPRV
jgi:two-component system chemotaxis response regulator CheB